MQSEFNPNCYSCPIDRACFERYLDAVGDAAAAESDVDTYNLAFRHMQASYQIMQSLEATGIPGEVDQERALVKDVAGVDLPTEHDLIEGRAKIEALSAVAANKKADADEAKSAYDELTFGCQGPTVRHIAGFTIQRCQGNNVSLRDGINVKRSRY